MLDCVTAEVEPGPTLFARLHCISATVGTLRVPTQTAHCNEGLCFSTQCLCLCLGNMGKSAPGEVNHEHENSKIQCLDKGRKKTMLI